MPTFFTQFIEFFKNLPGSRKVSFIALFLFVIVASIVLIGKLNSANFDELYSNLSDQNAGRIINHLKTQNIKYRVTKSGAIEVPRNLVRETRMNLAVEGLTEGDMPGFDLFDKPSIMVTDYVQKINYNRALQGEISKTICKIYAVDTCRVHIAKSEPSLFVSEEQKTTAAVVLSLFHGMHLSNSQIRGVVNLVAGSVEGLSTEDVSVLNSNGDLLSSRAKETMVDATRMQYDYKTTFEKNLEKRIQSMLGKTMGQERVSVGVSADFDFTRTETTSEIFDPDMTAVISTQKSTESGDGSYREIRKGPGAEANLPSESPTGTGATVPVSPTVTYELSNYKVSGVKTTVISPSGQLKKVSVSVMIDGTYETAEGKDGDVTKKYIARTKDEMKTFESIVKSTMGFDEDRGDQVTVANVQFQSSTGEAETDSIIKKMERNEMIRYYTKILGIVLLIAFIVFFIIKPVVKQILAVPVPRLELMDVEGIRVRELEAGLAGVGAGAPEALLEATQLTEEEKLAEREDVLDKQIDEIARNKPEKAAKVMKKWLSEK